MADYFAMSNEVAESNADEDLGSGGEMLLPDLTDSAGTVRHLMVGAGKDGNLYVVDRDSMGKFNPNQNENLQFLPNAIGTQFTDNNFSTPAFFNSWVYFIGEKLEPLCEPSQNGWFLLWPQAHQK